MPLTAPQKKDRDGETLALRRRKVRQIPNTVTIAIGQQLRAFRGQRGMTQLGINYAGWNPDWFKTFLGVMLLGSTLLNVYLKRKAEQR